MYRYLQRLEGVGSLGLELLADVNYLTWVLGTELGSSGRAAGLLTTEVSLQPCVQPSDIAI